MSQSEQKETIEELAASLEKISQKKLKYEIVRHWFQGREPYFDLFVNTLHDTLVWFQFTFRGHSICWSQQDPIIRTGVTTDFALQDVSYYSATKTVKLDEEIDPQFLAFCKKLAGCRATEEPFRSILKVLSSPPDLTANQ